MDVAVELERVIRELAAALPPDFKIEHEMGLAATGLGLDSIAIFELLVACDERFGIRLPEELFEENLTVGRLIEAIEREIAAR